MVGAVVVREGVLVGEGYHRQAGSDHAEVLALREAGEKARGGTLYVNLEPCCHLEKRTPPCTDVIIRSGISHVVLAMKDPNPAVWGKGIRVLKEHGVAVSDGILSKESFEQNKGFASLIRQGRPFVTLKGAMSLDGKIATESGDSQWISGEQSLRYAHRLRDSHDAIVVGISTALKDNPKLTTRIRKSGGHQPIRVILDASGRLSPASKLFGEPEGGPVWVVVGTRCPKESFHRLSARGARVLTLPETSPGQIDLWRLLMELKEAGALTVLVEGGSKVNASFLNAALVDRIRVVLAPLIIGGGDAIGWIGGHSPGRLSGALRLPSFSTVRRLGQDLLVGADLWGLDELPPCPVGP
jgi:diaminohydroxyphosphoribosylaminopyrimidine deaminase/5-amino-6-(5-phosphoribosylamino)uracil reductase